MSTTYLTQALHRALCMHPEKLATVYQGRRRTYREFAGRVARLAGALQELGMNAGDRVGILSLNSDRYLELYFAIWWGGGVVNPINIRWSAREIAYSLDDCQTEILAIDDSFVKLVPELAERSEALRTIVNVGEGNPSSGMFAYEQMIAEHVPVKDVLRSNEDLAGIFYTGGTTGFPKGVMLTHGNLCSGAAIAVMEGVVAADDIGLHAAPMFHLADGMFALALMLRGCTHVMVPMFKPEWVLRTIEEERVSALLLVPTMIQMLVEQPDLGKFQLDSIRRIAYGASPISEALLETAMRTLPTASFLQCYGQTEMSPVVTVLGPECHSPAGRKLGLLRSAGRPASMVEVRIVDAEGREVPRGVVGEIAARGPGVMLGYWNNPAQTAAALRDGWMHTGDGAYMDEAGFVFVVDRLKDMIVSGGENVYSAEVENVLARHEAIAMCAVIGVPHDRWGEAAHAIVVLKAGRVLDAEQVKQHCAALIAGYKCPRTVEFRDSLPLSGAGKVQKDALRVGYWKDRGRSVA